MSLHTCADNAYLCNVCVALHFKIGEGVDALDCLNGGGTVRLAYGEGDILCAVPADGLKDDVNVYVLRGKLAEVGISK